MKKSLKVQMSNYSVKDTMADVKELSRKNRQTFQELDNLTEKFLGHNRSLMDQFASIQRMM